MSVNSRL